MENLNKKALRKSYISIKIWNILPKEIMPDNIWQTVLVFQASIYISVIKIELKWALGHSANGCFLLVGRWKETEILHRIITLTPQMDSLGWRKQCHLAFEHHSTTFWLIYEREGKWYDTFSPSLRNLTVSLNRFSNELNYKI